MYRSTPGDPSLKGERKGGGGMGEGTFLHRRLVGVEILCWWLRDQKFRPDQHSGSLNN